MRKRAFLAALAASALALPSTSATAGGGVTTVDRTIVDRDNDNLLDYGRGDAYLVIGGPAGFRPPAAGAILSFIQMTDFQVIDEESPARVEFLDRVRTSNFQPFDAAFRPMESLTTQIVESMARAIRRTASPVTGRAPALTILTGDNADNQEYVETRWIIDTLDGGHVVNPNTGVPSVACPGTPGSVYDGVRGGGEPHGYYEPDESGPGTDGNGYSPDRQKNMATVGRDVTVRDFRGLLEAANQPFTSVGIGMPWYSAFGNHDALIQGNSPDAYAGPFGPSGEAFVAHPFHDLAISCLKASEASDESPTTLVGDEDSAIVVPPDPRRCFLAKDAPVIGPPGTPCERSSYIQEHFRTTGQPKGHGFAPALTPDEQAAGYGRPFIATVMHDGYYSFSPVEGIRFVALDSVTDECGHLFCVEGSIDDPQFQWLKDQIERAEEMGQYVIPYAHHTLATMRQNNADPTEYPVHYGYAQSPSNPLNIPTNIPLGQTLQDLFCEHPNVIAYVAGHEHENDVRHHDCGETDPGDFWEISTAAHIDWPQQARMIELVANGDGTMSLVLTIIDHAAPPKPGHSPLSPDERGQVLKLASIGRELAYNDWQADRAKRGGEEDRNVIIVLDRPWPAPTPG